MYLVSYIYRGPPVGKPVGLPVKLVTTVDQALEAASEEFTRISRTFTTEPYEEPYEELNPFISEELESCNYGILVEYGNNHSHEESISISETEHETEKGSWVLRYCISSVSEQKINNIVGTSCAVCLGHIWSDQCLVLRCQHSFHVNCIIKLQNYSNSCPLCRTSMTSSWQLQL